MYGDNDIIISAERERNFGLCAVSAVKLDTKRVPVIGDTLTIDGVDFVYGTHWSGHNFSAWIRSLIKAINGVGESSGNGIFTSERNYNARLIGDYLYLRWLTPGTIGNGKLISTTNSLVFTSVPAFAGGVDYSPTADLNVAKDHTLTTISDGTTDLGLLNFRSIALNSTAVFLATGPLYLHNVELVNPANAFIYFKFYDLTSVTPASDVPVYAIGIRTLESGAREFLRPYLFKNGLCVRAVSGAADNDTGAPSVNCQISGRLK